MQKINGKKIADDHAKALKIKIKELKKKLGPQFRVPAIVSFCNQDDPPSVKYTQMKQNKAKELGINFIAEIYNTDSLKNNLEKLIKKYNNDKNIDGIMVQLPVSDPLRVFKDELLTLIDPKKDVDGLTKKGQEYFLPATAKAVLTILNESIPNWQTSNFQPGVVGSQGGVGKPLVELLKKEIGLLPVKIDKNIGNLESDLKKCALIVSATGHEHLIKWRMIKKGAILIDVGLGDFDPKCYKKASFYTPRIGGVGPVTVVSLMENVLEAYKKSKFKT